MVDGFLTPGSLCSSSLTYEHLRKRLLRLDSLEELLLADLLVRIEVNPPNHGTLIRSRRVMLALRDQKSLQAFLINMAQAVIINDLKACIRAESFRRNQLLLEHFGLSVECDLKQEQLGHFFLDVEGQVILVMTCHGRSLRRFGSQFIIGAREHHLHEVRIVQSSIEI